MALNIASKIPFSDVCKVCDKIQTSPRNTRCAALREYIKEFRKFGESLKLENPQTDINFYPVLRLLMPHFDKERPPYGVKEHTLAKIYIRILCLPKEGTEASKLLNFRAPKSAGNQAGDFADVAYWILKSRCRGGNTFTVADVNSHLDAIAQKHAAHDPRGIDNELTLLLTGMSAIEQKWLMRIILKDMKLGVGHTGLFNAFHPDAAALYDVSNNLSKVCTLLHDPTRRLHEVEISLFSPFRPMLSEQCDVQKVEDCMKNRSFYYIETKHDGERFQIHYNMGSFKYFSRNGFDFTDSFGCNAMAGVLTPYLAKQLTSSVRSFILDGEMMVWDKKLLAFRSKGDNFDVKSLKSGGYLQPCYCVFDILLYNDEVLTNKPLHGRIEYLNNVFTPCEGIITHTERQHVQDRAEVIEHLNEAIDNKLEGIILKDPESVYKPNSRKGGWYKIKPEYTDGLMDQVDAIIVGGYYGEGRRKGNISSFLLAAAVANQDGGDPKEFHSLVRVGSGYTMAKLEELHQKLKPNWKKCPVGECPPGLVWTKEKPDVWIEPKLSYILQIKATEIVESSAFKTGFTLRFPRVEEIRYDKKWTDCITISQLQELRQAASGKLYSRHAVADPDAASPKKKRLVGRQVPKLGKQFCSADVTSATVKTAILEGKEFCVLTDYDEMSKQKIETMIYENGGTFAQNPGPATFCVLASSKENIRVHNLSLKRLHNIVHIKWLLNSLSEKTLLPWTPELLISSTKITECEMLKKYDRYGDSFTELVAMGNLKELLDKVKDKNGVQKLSAKEMADIDTELFFSPSPFGFFRLSTAFFDVPQEVDYESFCARNDLEVQKIDFLYYGGTLSIDIDSNTTHVIVDSRCPARISKFRTMNQERTTKFHIVKKEWIADSVRHGHQMNERNY